MSGYCIELHQPSHQDNEKHTFDVKFTVNGSTVTNLTYDLGVWTGISTLAADDVYTSGYTACSVTLAKRDVLKLEVSENTSAYLPPQDSQVTTGDKVVVKISISR